MEAVPAMDELLPQLLAFPPHPPPPQPLSDITYDKQIRALVQLLNQTSASKLVGGVSGGGNLLDVRLWDASQASISDGC